MFLDKTQGAATPTTTTMKTTLSTMRKETRTTSKTEAEASQ